MENARMVDQHDRSLDPGCAARNNVDFSSGVIDLCL